MDVTIENFQEVLAEFDEVIESASFFSVDSEFTGLYSERTPPFSTPSEFYKKIHQGTDDYIIIQLGITAFHLASDDADKFVYKSYNFYVYPQGRDQVFKCSGSSMTFLAQQKFDFNQLFSKGISCCTQDMANKLRAQYEEKQRYREDALESAENEDRPANHDDVPVPLEELDKMNEIRQKIQKFLMNKDENNITIGNCNAFQRKLMYQMIDKEFGKEVTTVSQMVNNQKAISIERKWSSQQQQDAINVKNEEDENEYRRLVGMSALLQKISKSKKLIVGHNMFLDLFYLIRQFFEPLPDTLKAFKKQAHKIFPNILDTKHVCNEKFRTEITSSVLKNVLATVSQPPFKLPVIEAESPAYEYNDIKEHEAGYDSYITGVCFLGLAKQLHIKNAEINSKSTHLRTLLNKIFIMRLTDIYFIDLLGNEPEPCRDHVFHIDFPASWKQSDLVNHFRKFGPIFIRWINNSSAFVALNHRENAPILLKTIGYTKGVKISTFAIHQKAMDVESDNEVDDAAAERSSANKRQSPSASNERPDKKIKLMEKGNKGNKKQNEKEKSSDDTMFVKEDEWPQETFA